MKKMDSGIHVPKTDTLKQRISLIGYKTNKPDDFQDDTKTSRSNYEDPVLGKLSYSLQNELFPIANSNSGYAKVESPSTQLAYSVNLKPSRTKHNLNLSEGIKNSYTTQSVEKIVKSLESPQFFEKHIGQESPGRQDERKSNDIHGYSCKTSPTQQTVKANRWKKLEGLFNGKKREPKIVPTQSRYPGSPKSFMAFKQVQTSTSGSLEAEEKERTAPLNSCVRTKSKMAYPKQGSSRRRNISPIKFDNQYLERSISKDISPTLDVEIPNIKLDRYSVMFSGVLQNSPSNVRSFNTRQRANVEKFKKINEELAAKERELDEKSKRLEQIASSSKLKLKSNTASCSRETSSSKLGLNNQEDISLNFSHSNEPSTFTSSSCLSLDFEASYESNYLSSESTSGDRPHHDARKNMCSPFQLPEVPQGFELGLTNEQYFEFGFSDFLINSETKNLSSSFLDVKQSKELETKSQTRSKEFDLPFFSPNSSLDSLPSTHTTKTSMNSPSDISSSAVKKLISSDTLSELWNQGHEPYLYTSNSSLTSNSSSPTSNKSSITPLSVSSSTGYYEENDLKFLPHFDAALPSCIPASSVVTICTADPNPSYQNIGKSSYSSRVPRALKRAPSSSKRSESSKTFVKPSHNKYQKKTKLSSPTISSPFPYFKQSNTVKIASKAVGSPLDTFALATNEELAHFICPSRTGTKELPSRGDSSFLNQHNIKERLIIGAKPRIPDLVVVDEDDKQMWEAKLPFFLQSCNKILEDAKFSDSFNIGVVQNDDHFSHDGTPNYREVLANKSRKSHHVVVERINSADT
ncbi:hypothetical protein GcM3_214017 [Golovinomyces cichoracearum]|uniref:Uncharacterized protein n=1 Tax=Golovinomyces cichoracearum TaxID=62708 RepID=A0A420H916_9PEZI|nr:hypothetical protein GcM3_214017 [Golovinomyces cichoracearum]